MPPLSKKPKPILTFTCLVNRFDPTAFLKVGTDMVENLLFLFMVKDLGTSNALCGIALAITVRI